MYIPSSGTVESCKDAIIGFGHFLFLFECSHAISHSVFGLSLGPYEKRESLLTPRVSQGGNSQVEKILSWLVRIQGMNSRNGA